MKSYGDEYYDNPNQRVIDDSTYMFIETLNSVEGKDVYIDDVLSKAYITNSSNPNNENKEERTINVLVEQPIKTGSYIKGYDEGIYLTISGVDNHISHKEAKIRRCNYILKWMESGILNSQPCIVTNNTKYTGGTKSQSNFTEVDAMVNITIQMNKNTDKISYGKRFYTMKNAWRVTLIDDITTENVFSWTLGKDSINYEIDDVINGICGAYENKHTYIYDIPTNFEVANGNEYTINYSIKDETGKDFDYSLINVTTTNNTLIQVTNTKGVISIKGLSVGIGSIKLSVPISSSSKDFDITFEVKDIVADKIEYTTNFSQGAILKTYMSSTISINKLINGIIDLTGIVNYSLDNIGTTLLNSGNISITRKTNTSFQIKNVNVSTVKNFIITFMDNSDGTIITTQQINFTGM